MNRFGLNRTGLLFPYKTQKVGWGIFALVLSIAVGGCIFNYGSAIYAELSLTLWTLVYVAAVLIGFSKEKDEDEFIEILRFKALKTMLCIELGVMVLSGLLLGFAEVGIHYHKRFYSALSVINYFCCRIEFAILLYMLIFKVNVWRYRREACADE